MSEEKEKKDEEVKKDTSEEKETAPEKDKTSDEKKEDKASEEKTDKEDKKPDKKKDKKKEDPRDEKIKSLQDQVLRQMAEFDNFRKRTEKEKSSMYDAGASDVIAKVLPVIDNFERGLADVKEDTEDAFQKGMLAIYKQLLHGLDELGVKEIEAEGKKFDPNFHNAVMHSEDENLGENVITNVFAKGYKIGDKVIRPAMVAVAN